jgi:serine/threonine protein kinase
VDRRSHARAEIDSQFSRWENFYCHSLAKMATRHVSRANREKQLIVHDYMIGQEIGRRHYGQIRVAVHRPLGIPFAVKMMAKKELALLRHGKSVLFNETILAPLFDHFAIMEIREVADSPSYIFQFMPLADHGTSSRGFVPHPLILL